MKIVIIATLWAAIGIFSALYAHTHPDVYTRFTEEDAPVLYQLWKKALDQTVGERLDPVEINLENLRQKVAALEDQEGATVEWRYFLITGDKNGNRKIDLGIRVGLRSDGVLAWREDD